MLHCLHTLQPFSSEVVGRRLHTRTTVNKMRSRIDVLSRGKRAINCHLASIHSFTHSREQKFLKRRIDRYPGPSKIKKNARVKWISKPQIKSPDGDNTSLDGNGTPICACSWQKKKRRGPICLFKRTVRSENIRSFMIPWTYYNRQTGSDRSNLPDTMRC